MLLAHDLGTTGNKASIHDAAGRLLDSVTVGYGADFGPGGTAEQDPQDWFDAVCEAGRTLIERNGTDPARIEAVGFSGQMMGAVFLDKRLAPLRPAIIWADHRSTEQVARVEERIGVAAVYRLTGHRLHPTYSLAKILWVRDHQPEVFAATSRVCLAKDYVVARLTGNLVTDPSDASSTNLYDQRAGTWSPDILAAAGLDIGLLPEVVPATTVVGGLLPELASQTGLKAGTPIVIGGGDGPLAAVGAGVVDEGSGAYAYLGSSSWVSLASLEPIYDPPMRTMTFNHVVPGRFVPTATMQAGGASLEWIADVLEPDPGPERFARLVADADAAVAADEGLFFLPHLLGERSPHWNARARGAFVGLAKHHGPASMTRAVLEGVAFNLAVCVDSFRESGATIDEVDAIGGGAARDVWLQMLADVWGCKVRRRTIVEEANSLGAAVTAGVAVGLFDGFEVAGGLSEITARFVPHEGRHRAYQEHLREFANAYARLEPWFEAPWSAP